jgi:CRISPR-associated protein Csc2
MKPLTSEWFVTQVPGKPMGRYAHVILLRVTDSYPLFQTDGELNTARVRAGVTHTEPMTRLTIFKRKQTTPERLVGRELLRRHGLLSSDAADGKAVEGQDHLPICDYNVQFCTQCPDCITYGFAIGDAGSEKSKVITDTAYSLTSYDHSHQAFTLNAPYEDGTMTRHGDVTSRFSEQDHVQPQVIFPAVVTVRDVTENLFLYVLISILRTRRYGAQTTRTGRLQNRIVAVALTDGEVFSNLLFTQRLYDALAARGAINPPDPVDPDTAFTTAQNLVPEMIREDGVAVSQLLTRADVDALLAEMAALSADDARLKGLLEDAFADSRAYHAAWVAKATKRK